MPRSGTSLLGGLLASTGRAGRPGEWFDPIWEPPGARTNYLAFVDRVVRGRSVAGVFGVKFVHNQLWSFLDTLRSLPGNAGRSDRELLEHVFPQPRFVLVERGDIVAQAVSWWRAEQTGEWKVAPGTKRKQPLRVPEFDFDEIDRLKAEIVRGNQRWDDWFAASGIEPFRVAYEALAGDYLDTARSVLQLLEIEFPGVMVEPRTARQADDVNAEWIARYSERASSIRT